MTPGDLAAIRARAEHARISGATSLAWSSAMRDIPALLAEVERLQVENKQIRAALGTVTADGQLMLAEIRKLRENEGQKS